MDVAVVIPVGSVDPILSDQVHRVINQSGVPLTEVVLSVNSKAAEVVAGVAEVVAAVNDSRLRVVDSSDQRGAAHARNVGVASTTTAAIAFCDADDLVHHGWLAALVDGLEHFDAVSGRTIDVFPEARMADWYPPATPGGLNSFLGEQYLLTGNLAVHRDAFEAVGGFDETLTRCEDIALSWSLARAGFTIGYANDAAIDYRHRAGVVPMLRQYYLYGRGMSEVLRKYGAPRSDGLSSSRGIGMLRPNGQRAGRRTLVGAMRRGALGVGRVRGLVPFPRGVAARIERAP